MGLRNYRWGRAPADVAADVRCDRARTSVRTADKTSNAATKNNPPWKLPVISLIQPIIAGPTKPPRLPIELMVAIPAAAAEPDRNMVGMLHSGGLAALMPMLTRVSAATTDTTEVAAPASIRPAEAAMQAATTCHVRSPVRSEWRAQSTMATTATVGGMALSSPTCMVERPNSLMICGAQMPSV